MERLDRGQDSSGRKFVRNLRTVRRSGAVQSNPPRQTIEIGLPYWESNMEVKQHLMNARIRVSDEQPADVHTDMIEALPSITQ